MTVPHQLRFQGNKCTGRSKAGNTWERNVGWALETRVVVTKPLTEKRQISEAGPRDKLA